MTSYTDILGSGKRQILVADDEFINREILENVLADDIREVRHQLDGHFRRIVHAEHRVRPTAETDGKCLSKEHEHGAACGTYIMFKGKLRVVIMIDVAELDFGSTGKGFLDEGDNLLLDVLVADGEHIEKFVVVVL